jgi:hypothetical protein
VEPTEDIVVSAIRANPCPYASVARLTVGTSLTESDICSCALNVLLKEFESFCYACRDDQSDTFVLPITHCNDVEVRSWGRITAALLGQLKQIDGDDARLLPDSDGWDFTVHGIPFFVMLFAPVYPHSHSRASELPDLGYYLFHPEQTFRRYGVSSRRPDRRELSAQIREMFVARGKSYPLQQVTSTPKYLRYVKPLCEAHGPVLWHQSFDA